MDDKQEIKEAFATFLPHPCKKNELYNINFYSSTHHICVDLYLCTYVFLIYSAIIIKIH